MANSFKLSMLVAVVAIRIFFFMRIATISYFPFGNNLNISFEIFRDKNKNNFADKNTIPNCCAWRPELKDGVLTYTIQYSGE